MAISKFQCVEDYTLRAGDYLVLPYLDEKKALFAKKALPKALARVVAAPEQQGGTRTALRCEVDGVAVLASAIRLDAKHSNPATELKKAVAAALNSGKREEAKRVVVALDGKRQDLMLAVQEGALLGGYVFDPYLSDKPKPLPVLLAAPGGKSAAFRRANRRRAELYTCTNFTRDVLNEPPNEMTPPVLARAFRKMGKASGLKVTTWNEARLKREGCGGILGVGQGAKARPALVIGEYAPRGAKGHLCLVGKGVTFDSGGYGLKPASSQIGMKYDMGGAAMMFGAACAIARLKLRIRVTVITPLVENDISGEAFHTTSVLRTRSGRTVEVHHTDAEGRLILADALTIAAERKPDWIVDAATLTGACVVALGEDISAAFGTDPAFTRLLIDAGRDEGERFWELPLHMPYEEGLKTTIADCKNVAGRWGGAVTAALFLKKWVSDDAKWIHCDIAGPGCKEGPLDHLGKGAKGFGVKTIAALASRLADSHF
ncbi:MAG: leucyl aminopeptidase family protein [bacterium]|nr:leucyl aminopeptidase family protein [bacterium]